MFPPPRSACSRCGSGPGNVASVEIFTHTWPLRVTVKFSSVAWLCAPGGAWKWRNELRSRLSELLQDEGFHPDLQLEELLGTFCGTFMASFREADTLPCIWSAGSFKTGSERSDFSHKSTLILSLVQLLEASGSQPHKTQLFFVFFFCAYSVSNPRCCWGFSSRLGPVASDPGTRTQRG